MKTGLTTHAPSSLQESNGLAAPDAMAILSAPPIAPKYKKIYEDLLSAIRSGAFKPGDRLPSEVDLGKQYSTSRITVAKAINELQQKGLVTRRPGSGTHILGSSASSGCVFG